MDDATRKRLAASLHLPEDATEEQISAAADEAADAAEEAKNVLNSPETGKPAKDVKPEDEPPAHQTPPGTAPSGTGAPDVNAPEDDVTAGKSATVAVDREIWEETQASAKLARKHEDERISARQAEKISAAVQAGKFAPARKKHYATLMAADEEGTTQLLDSLQPGLVPVTERGTTGGGDGEGVAATSAEGLPDSWFPEVNAKRVAASTGQVVTQAREG